MAEKKTFAKGMYGNNPRDGAPDFVIGRVSFKVDDFVAFLKDNVNDKGYVNIDINKGKEGKWNCFLNEYGLVKKTQEAPPDSDPF